MNIRLLLLTAMLAVTAIGCRRDPYMQVYIDNMNAEKRLLEDTLYDLQYDYETKSAEVAQLRQELDQLKSGGTSVLGSGRASTRSAQDSGPRDLYPGGGNLEPPTIDQGSPQPKEDDGAGMDTDDLEPPQLDLGDDTPVSALPMPLDDQITDLYVNAAHTGGLQSNDQPGDDGIVLVFQPRNRDNDFVPLPGPVSVVLLDPETRERVARWEFSREETEMALQQARASRGIELRMPWQDTPPTKSRLHLYVRYWLSDKQAVQSDREITITPNGQLAARWTPRTETRPSPTRVNIADQRTDEDQPVSAPPAPSSDWEAAATQEPVTVPRQAGLPQWRPYR